MMKQPLPENNSTSQSQASHLVVEDAQVGQRIDNFLFSRTKGVPKSRVYRALRSGEIRVNKKRVKADYRLQAQDDIRLPPLRVATREKPKQANTDLLQQLEQAVIYEDNHLIIINKPSGIATHGGSGISFGVIEAFRQLRPKTKYLELAHRLDRETTGCLVMVKKPSILKELHQLLAISKVKKTYLALVKNAWSGNEKKVSAPLLKNQLHSGERIVTVNEQGKSAETVFKPLKVFKNATLVEAKPVTGRTHQIRVHAAHIGHPIIGDDKYGDKKFNQDMRRLGAKHLLLHSASISFHLPAHEQVVAVCACLDSTFSCMLQAL